MERPVLSAIRAEAPKHASIPFWSWNDKLEPEALRAQIRRMKELGMGGFFMHARGGLETEYLSDEWFAAVDACVDEAKKLGMEAWAYDENGWPSGFAGGILLKDARNFALALMPSEEETLPAEDVFGAYVRDGAVLRRAKAGDAGPFLVIRVRADDSYVDTMDASVTAKFLAATHEEYARRIAPGDLGTVMPGFFTDEPQYFRWDTPYSHVMEAEFAARYGYDVHDAAPALFWDYEGAESHRYDYYSLCHDLFIQNFIRPVYEWCDAHGLQLTGHAVEEASLSGQMMCCGGVMPFYEYEHIPGMDYLGRGLATDLAPRQLGSVCAQLGRRRVLSEMFACSGWDVTPRELRDIAELQYVGGVNLTCQHLYPLSSRGQRKRDYPAHYSEILPWQDQLGEFNRYFNHLGAALSLGEEIAPVLVIHPMHSAYLHYKRKGKRPRVDELNAKLEALIARLGDAQIGYHFGDERLMAKYASVEGARIRVGRCVYDTVILPDCETLDASTVKLLRAYLAAGGRLCCAGERPVRVDGRPADLSDIAANCRIEDLPARSPVQASVGGAPARKVRVMLRRTEFGRILFVKNLSGTDLPDLTLSLSDFAGAERIDLFSLTARPLPGRVSNGRLEISLPLEAGHSALLAECGAPTRAPDAPAPDRRSIPLDLPFEFDVFPENMMLLDRAALSLDGGPFSELRPIERIRDNLLSDRFKGRVALRFPFTAKFRPDALRAVCEPAAGLRISLNGQPLSPLSDTRLDPRFLSFDAAPAAAIGENVLEISLDYAQRPEVYDVLYGDGTESLRNCLCFDAEIECAYLFGDFALETQADRFTDAERNAVCYDGTFALIPQQREVDPTDLVRAGYPFYGGPVRLAASFAWKPGDPTALSLSGRFAVCGVEINGHDAGTLMFESHVDLAPFLTEGKNRLVLTPCNALRNLIGPHHRPNPEPYGVGPNTFSYEKEWHGGECGEYLTRYAFVRFGFDKK